MNETFTQGNSKTYEIVKNGGKRNRVTAENTVFEGCKSRVREREREKKKGRERDIANLSFPTHLPQPTSTGPAGEVLTGFCSANHLYGSTCNNNNDNIATVTCASSADGFSLTTGEADEICPFVDTSFMTYGGSRVTQKCPEGYVLTDLNTNDGVYTGRCPRSRCV